jgi:tRNA(fMet)-specific endonuclease VapC
MKYLLDTDTCSYIVKTPDLMKPRFEKIQAGDIAISAITWAELNSWVMGSSKPEQRRMSLQKMFAPISILSFTADDASFHGAIRKELKDQGKMIGALDLLIAAHARSRGLIVVTNNTDHFGRVKNLKIENWFKK